MSNVAAVRDEALNKSQGDSLLRGYVAIRRWALSVAIMIFPLIWMGGLVTTHDAGMAVPDWPGTYGYNLFLYPLSTWISGPFDLLVEHGHRLLGAVTGFLAIGLVVTVWRTKASPWLMRWSIVLLLAICAQGALGGVRVLQVNRIMAMVHGCTGPLVFVLACYVAVLATRERKVPSATPSTSPGSEQRGAAPKFGALYLCYGLTGIAFLQLVMGACLRHLNVNLTPTQFMAVTHVHLTLAAALTLGIVALFLVGIFSGWRQTRKLPKGGPGFLVLLILIQVFLGCLTWYVNYALPWSGLSPTLSAHVNHLKGLSETMIVTAHQAVGSVILITLFLNAVRIREISHSNQIVCT